VQKVKISIFGRVQGVFFRASTKEIAEKLGLCGYAKNSPDGSVEVIAEGHKDKLEKLIEYCKKGPIAAKVEKINIRYSEASGKFHDFGIRY
jgi:acylphosphatase